MSLVSDTQGSDQFDGDVESDIAKLNRCVCHVQLRVRPAATGESTVRTPTLPLGWWRFGGALGGARAGHPRATHAHGAREPAEDVVDVTHQLSPLACDHRSQAPNMLTHNSVLSPFGNPGTRSLLWRQTQTTTTEGLDNRMRWEQRAPVEIRGMAHASSPVRPFRWEAVIEAPNGDRAWVTDPTDSARSHLLRGGFCL